MKIKCGYCKEEKELSEFWEKDLIGLLEKEIVVNCRLCKIEISRLKSYKKRRLKIIAKQKAYQKTDKGKEVRKRADKKYQKTDKGKAARKRAIKKNKIRLAKLKLECGTNKV